MNIVTVSLLNTSHLIVRLTILVFNFISKAALQYSSCDVNIEVNIYPKCLNYFVCVHLFIYHYTIERLQITFL